MIRLIISADDLGLHHRIDEGIFAAHTDGVLTSATLLVVGPTAAEAARRAERTSLGLGLNLCLTTHLTPAANPRDVRWLAPGGRFRRDWAELSAAWLSRLIPPEEVLVEFHAQVRRAREMGARIDHLATRGHLHLLPGLTDLVETIAAELNVPVRWPRERPNVHWLVHPASAAKSALIGVFARGRSAGPVKRVRALGVFESGRLTERRLIRLIGTLRDGEVEIVTHPGLDPGRIPEAPRWSSAWEAELAALLSPRVREAIARRGIELITYAQL